MTGKTIGWGLVGASTIAREWMVDAIRSNADSRIEAVFSGDMPHAKAFAAEKGIPNAYGSLTDLLENPQIDTVYISSTNERHFHQTLAAATAGKHVLCEKPLALEVDEAEQMVETCKRAGVVLGTNHHLRNMESHRAIKRLIDEGAIGKVTSIRVFHAGQLPEELKTWRLFEKSAGAGAIFDLTVHDADLLRFYLGRNPLRMPPLQRRRETARRTLKTASCRFGSFQRTSWRNVTTALSSGQRPAALRCTAVRAASLAWRSCHKRLAAR